MGSLPRYTPFGRASLIALLVGVGGFFLAMSVFVSQHTELSCTAQPVACERVETYPFGVEIRTAVAPFSHASTRVQSGRRGETSVNLVLNHLDGTATDYPGVGTNGHRAVRTAEQLNAFLDAPQNPIELELRSGSIVVAVFLLILGLGALFVVPSTFSQVDFTSQDSERLKIRIGRWPLPAEEHVLQRDRIGGIELRLVGSGRLRRHQLFLLVEDEAAVDLRIADSLESTARKRAQEVEALLESLRDA